VIIMDYANLAGFAIAGTSGLILGKVFGQKLAADGMSALRVIETRLASMESMLAGGGVQAAATAAHAPAEKYDSAITKLAAAIEKHAAAIDDHGAATVAAAVETYAAMHPSANAVAARSA
jgi:hypothetical protein